MRVEHLNLTYEEKQVLKDFSLELPDVPVLGFTGPSGCGKTSLLRILAGLTKPDSGTVHGWNTCAVLFQENRLLPWRTVEQNITDVMPHDRRHEAAKWLALGELEGEEKQYPSQLSGGMARRLAVARCAALGGDVLLLDEPFTGVDPQRAGRILSRLRELGVPIVLVSHEPELLAQCDKVISFEGTPLRVV